MIKVLTLSCFTGEGHNSAARAVCEALTESGAYIETVDPVSLKTHRQSISSTVYNGMIKRHPRAFGAIYRAGKVYDASGMRSPVYLINAHYAKKLNEYITQHEFDDVVDTNLYGMEAMTAIRRRIGGSIPFFGVLTDYTCIPFMTETSLDGYFVPHAEIKDLLIRRGMPETRIHPTGIPVSPSFAVRRDKAEMRAELGIPQDKKIILIMTGGVGCEKMLRLCEEAARFRADTVSYVLVGHNGEMKETIEGRYGTLGAVRAVPFTTEVYKYVDAADALITKPGGLSSTEAAVAGIPTVHYGAIPGCETKNQIFFESHGMSRKASTPAEALSFAHDLASDPDAAEAMRQAQREQINPHAAQDIARMILEACARS